MSFLQLNGRRFIVFGVANRKSVAWHVAKELEEEGATVLHSVRNAQRRESLAKLMGDRACFTCDVEEPDAVGRLAEDVREHGPFHGILHSIAFANYAEGLKPFHETRRDDFLQAVAISCFSLVEIARALKPLLTNDAAVVSIGISSQVLAENYGYMSPVKAQLESTSRWLAKSFSRDSRIRFNTVGSSPLKTSASAGIPGYLENYLFAEQMTLRKQAVMTAEVARVAAFLLSPASSGINAQTIVVNQGMDLNYFDQEIVQSAMRSQQ